MSREPLPSSFDNNPYVFPCYHEPDRRTRWVQKFTRRLKEEPLIPLGCAATCYALYRAYRSMRAGDSAEMNRMFRARIYAQAFTLVALVAGGMYFKTERQQRREFEQAVELRKKQEKRDAWLKELEVRDKEDREWRERHAAIEAAAKEAGKKPDQTPPQQPPQQPDAARSAIELADEKRMGVLDAVKMLISKQN
ncbi:hypothetical protein N7468_006580 [Penicillium chermesinum]|uniref:HIG1 domain-containing protein n=1 Tax=Penicillium chermesinum TaxID=63820 RepID=A0A9W9NSK0_9EURO|nr:uncharacterized protein N7468_006580 [Penicillium chermesinum]KAJ5225355.1 hypothetical protein N7468_006580 [Penicillium chermesinum]KAJ6161419.1 hypothetical protein N7470_004815 [Penicillium chermesinum]